MIETQPTYLQILWKKFRKHRLGLLALYVVILFCLVGVYAPLLASSKPILVIYNGEYYFPLFRYLFFNQFYTKRLDIFFNLMMVTLPLFLLALKLMRGKIRMLAILLIIAGQLLAFGYYAYFPVQSPDKNPAITAQHEEVILQNSKSGKSFYPDWNFELAYMTPYAKLNQIIKYQQEKAQHDALSKYAESYSKQTQQSLPTLWQVTQDNEAGRIQQAEQTMAQHAADQPEYQAAKAQLDYIQQKRKWLEEQSAHVTFQLNPLFSSFHWEDDAGGSQSFNQYIPWWDLTRVNRKDLLSALIFGVRISLVVGIASVAISLLISIPVGAFAGFYGGKIDIIICRILEIWEAMPTFFMLLMAVGILQSKSIFLVIAIIGLFGWTQFSRYIRGEFFKQRSLSYVEACEALGFRDRYVIFKHILPNAIPPVITLLPFAIMGAITSEAGLSFLGLGEENSSSWGVLMDEGRTAFPQESYLLWPPAILLTVLLIAIALVGDSLRDTLDPKKA